MTYRMANKGTTTSLMYSNSIREYNQKGFWLEIYPVYQAVVFRDPDVLQDFIYNQLIPNL